MHKDLGRDEYYGQNHKEPTIPLIPYKYIQELNRYPDSSSKLLKKAGQHVI